MAKQNVNNLYHDLEETLDNLLELRDDGYCVLDSQIVAATYSKVGYLQGVIENNPDFQYRKELSILISRIDFFFGIIRDKQQDKQEEPAK